MSGPAESADPRRAGAERPWWADAVVYQIYPRSFQDSDGDGVGDLRGITSRLDHIAELGADAIWLSPIYPSPLHDMGYDIADFSAVDPRLGTLEDFDELVAETHARGMRILLDLVPCHTSIEHPWFREHPERYVWSRVDGPENNWIAAFGGPAWSRDEETGRWYLHSFYPEQPDLDWRNPETREAMAGEIGFWIERGIDGYRVDAIDRLLKDPERRDDPPSSGTFPLPLPGDFALHDHVNSQNAPDIGDALATIRDAAGPDAFLAGEVFQPHAGLSRYLGSLDVAFAFEFLFSPWDAERLRAAIASGVAAERVAWVLSNHDFPRLITRLGRDAAELAATLLLTLPGPAFIYQGDEIGMADGPGGDPPVDRHGRDAQRHPMQWEPGPKGGFTAGEPWLPLTDPAERNVADQSVDPHSELNLYRGLIRLRHALAGTGYEPIDAGPEAVAHRRGEYAVVLNLGESALSAPVTGEVVVAVGSLRARAPQSLASGAELPPGSGVVVRRA
ncbi:alpha-amylase [Thermoleophilia bacterium SCSIO 60948]|nr:alpha-amylase [Thermoleophilia bacterium SCSIO 60948]